MTPKKMIRILQDTLVSRWFEILIFVILFTVDYGLIKPLYVYVFDLSEQLATGLSVGMAILYAVIAKVCSKLLAKGQILNAVIGISIFLVLMVFSFIGQEVAAHIQANDPLMFLSDEQPDEDVQSVQSKRHWIATGLTIALFSLAVFIGYLISRSDEAIKNDKKEITMSSIARWLQLKISILQSKHDRSSAKVTAIAEERVNSRIEKLENNLSEYKRIDRRLNGEKSYQLQHLGIVYDQTVSVIKAVYNKKSFFKSIIPMQTVTNNFKVRTNKVGSALFLIFLVS